MDQTVIIHALTALVVAGLLGAALALRPTRRGTPPRNPPVIETQNDSWGPW